MKRIRLTGLLSLGILVSGFAGSAAAATITVNGTDAVYTTSASTASSWGGTPAETIDISGDTSISFGVTGSVTLNNGNFNDPDGVGAAPSSSFNTGFGSLSGITAPDAGYLVGVFIPDGGPAGPAPAALDYTMGGNASESSSSYAPLLDQTFFIGDGLTGDGMGSSQTFVIPTGAAELWLGISDAGGYNGSPGAYGDNGGSFSVSYTAVGSTTTTPEPATSLLGISGIVFTGRRLRRRT